MKSHTPTSDRQLWKITDVRNGSEFAWPIYATPSTDSESQFYFVELAIAVESEVQWKFVSEILGQHAFDNDGARWLIRPTVFDRVANKCDGVTPAYYVKWPEGSAENPSEPKTTFGNQPLKGNSESEAHEFENFIRYCAAEAAITDIPTLRLMFQIFCRCGMLWLLTKRQPLNMGFCTLYALPLRKNFDTLLHQQWPHIHATLKRRKLRMGILEACGFIQSLHNEALVEMQTDNTFGWSLSVVENKPFDRQVEKIERETLQNSNANKYLMRLGSTIRKSYSQIVEVLASYYEKAGRQAAHVDTGMPRNQWRLSPKVPAYRPVPVRKKRADDGVADNSVEAAKESSGEGEADAQENASMQSVPNAE